MTIEEVQTRKEEEEEIEIRITDLINHYMKRYNLQLDRVDVTRAVLIQRLQERQ